MTAPQGSGIRWQDHFQPFDLASEMSQAGIAPAMVGEILYAGHLHTIFGPAGTGKTMLALHLVAEVVHAGGRVVLLDEESGPGIVAERLAALGLTEEQVRIYVTYLPYPGLQWTEEQVEAFLELIRIEEPALCVVDSAGAVLSAAGLDENSNQEVAGLYGPVFLKAARLGDCALLLIDLTGKGANQHQPRGASAKVQFVDVVYKLTAISAFDRSHPGSLTLDVTKDRLGRLDRRREIVVRPTPDGLTFEMTATTTEWTDNPVSPAARKILEALGTQTDPMTSQAIGDAIANKYGNSLKRPTMSTQLNLLLDLGLVQERGSRGKAKLWALVPEVSELSADVGTDADTEAN